VRERVRERVDSVSPLWKFLERICGEGEFDISASFA
jgi:hypothetical protein